MDEPCQGEREVLPKEKVRLKRGQPRAKNSFGTQGSEMPWLESLRISKQGKPTDMLFLAKEKAGMILKVEENQRPKGILIGSMEAPPDPATSQGKVPKEKGAADGSEVLQINLGHQACK